MPKNRFERRHVPDPLQEQGNKSSSHTRRSQRKRILISLLLFELLSRHPMHFDDFRIPGLVERYSEKSTRLALLGFGISIKDRTISVGPTTHSQIITHWRGTLLSVGVFRRIFPRQLHQLGVL